jgi:hypothetical protein
MVRITAMVKHEGFIVEFKHSFLEWICKDKQYPKTTHAADQHFSAQGRNITKQTIHGWLLIQDEICLNSDKKACKLSVGRNRPALTPYVEDILKDIILEERQEGN